MTRSKCIVALVVCVALGSSTVRDGRCNLTPRNIFENYQRLTRSLANSELEMELFGQPYDAASVLLNSSYELTIYTDVQWSRLIITQNYFNEIPNPPSREGPLRLSAYGSYGSEQDGINRLNCPMGIDINPEPIWIGGQYRWDVYVADSGNDRVVHLYMSFNGSTVSIVHARYIGEEILDDPSDVAYDVEGSFLYASDTGRHRIVAFDESGAVVSSYGSEGHGANQFRRPGAIAIDSSPAQWPDYLYVCDEGNERIVALKRVSVSQPPAPGLTWLNDYRNADIRPVGVGLFDGCGVYVLSGDLPSEGGSKVVSFDFDLSHRLGEFGHFGVNGGPSELHSPLSLVRREGEIGVVETYDENSGLGYYILTPEIVNARVTPSRVRRLTEHAYVSYGVTANSQVRARVFTEQWQLVKDLTSGWTVRCAGTWTHWWDGKNSAGQAVPLGQYILMLEARYPDGSGVPHIVDVFFDIVDSDIAVHDFPIDGAFPRWRGMSQIMYTDYNGIRIASIDGKNDQGLSTPEYPDWDLHPSNSDAFIVFTRANGTGAKIWKHFFWSGIEQRLSPLNVNDRIPAVSPDASVVAFLNDEDDNIWVCNAADGSSRVRITSEGGEEAWQEWSPNGHYLAYVGGMTSLKVCPYRGLDETRTLVQAPGGYLYDPRWDPSGELIGYIDETSVQEENGIRFVSVDGDQSGYIVRVEPGFGWDWSPDATKVVFAVGYDDLVIADVARGDDALPAMWINTPTQGQLVGQGSGIVNVSGTADNNVSVDGVTILSDINTFTMLWGRGPAPSVWSPAGISYNVLTESVSAFNSEDIRQFRAGRSTIDWSVTIDALRSDAELVFVILRYVDNGEVIFTATQSGSGTATVTIGRLMELRAVSSGGIGVSGEVRHAPYGPSEINNASLVKWNTAPLEAGAYTLRMTATDTDGDEVERRRMVYVREVIGVPSSDEESVTGISSSGAVPWLKEPIPNPFNPAAELPFFLPRAGMVKISVYDITGRLVNVLVDGVMSSGEHRVVWDGMVQGLSKAGSGVYLFRLDFEGERKVCKGVLLR